MLEELSKGELIKVNEESDSDEKDKDVLEAVTLAKNFTLKKILEIFHDSIRAKDKMIQAGSSIGRSMTSCKGIEKVFHPYS